MEDRPYIPAHGWTGPQQGLPSGPKAKHTQQFNISQVTTLKFLFFFLEKEKN